MATPQSFPPMRLHPSRPISPSSAQALIATYLDLSSRTPYLLPNSKLLPSGPSAQGAADGGPVLHNLRRVEAGLRGEVMAPSLDIDLPHHFDPEEEDGMEGVEYEDGLEGGKKGKKTKSADDMWDEAQPLGEYQREQSDEMGEVGDEQVNVVDAGEEGSSQVAKPLDKEARKAAKKARQKEQQKAKAHVKK